MNILVQWEQLCKGMTEFHKLVSVFEFPGHDGDIQWDKQRLYILVLQFAACYTSEDTCEQFYFKYRKMKVKTRYYVTIVWVPSKRPNSVYKTQKIFKVPFIQACRSLPGFICYNLLKSIVSVCLDINVHLIRLWTHDNVNISIYDGDRVFDITKMSNILYMSDIFPDDTCIESDHFNVD